MPSLLSKIPDEYKPLAAIGIGALIVVFIALFHGMGLHWILVQQRRGERRLRLGKPRVVEASFLFGWSVFLMLDLHIVEILIWSFALLQMGLVVHAYDAMYFCANGYTTLGMGKMDVGEHWRIISPIIGISGLFTFAWTTSSLVDVVASNRRLLNQFEEEREQEILMRLALHKQQWDKLRAEREAEREDKAKTKAAEVGSSLVQRFRGWREERKSLRELRTEDAAEMEDLRRQERLQEKGLEAKAASHAEEKNPE
jgi:hypothetical protein